jgi:hypothetical protein
MEAFLIMKDNLRADVTRIRCKIPPGFKVTNMLLNWQARENHKCSPVTKARLENSATNGNTLRGGVWPPNDARISGSGLHDRMRAHATRVERVASIFGAQGQCSRDL